MRPHSGAERPRFEPEIIPPARERLRQAEDDDGSVFIFVDREGRTHRVNVKKPSPLTVIIALLAFGLVSAVVLALLLGALLVWIPIAAALIAGVVGYAYIRGFWRRLRGRF